MFSFLVDKFVWEFSLCSVSRKNCAAFCQANVLVLFIIHAYGQKIILGRGFATAAFCLC